MTLEDHRTQAIRSCTLCDENGYRMGSTVCDHIDHRPIYARGMAAVNAVLEEARRSRLARPERTGE